MYALSGKIADMFYPGAGTDAVMFFTHETVFSGVWIFAQALQEED